MRKPAARRVMMPSIALGLACAIGAYAWRWFQPRSMHVIGTVVSVDVENRQGVLRVRLPKTGEEIDVSGQLAPDCAITHDDSPVAFSSVRPGQRVRADGRWYRNGKIEATALAIERQPIAGESSQGGSARLAP